MEKEILKKIVIENIELIKEIDLFRRNINIDNKANYIICGIRRCGKSFLQYQQIKSILKQNINEVIYINFEDERFVEFSTSDFDKIVECAFEIYHKKPIFFFDEIQNIEHWEKFARRLADQAYQIFITGSNAKMLGKEVATTLGGRYFIKDVFPLSFSEFLNFRKVKLEKNFSLSRQRFDLKKHFEFYMHFGGFPEMLKYQNPREYLTSIFMKVFYGDLVTRNHIQNEQILKLLIKKIAESVNNETSINRIKNLIKSTGIKIGNNTVTDYLNYLFDAYLIFPLLNYTSGFTERETKKKYYFIDQGILNLFLTDQDTKLLENIVFIELLRRYGQDIFYYKRKYEVDFYLPEEQMLIQVSYSIDNIETKEREIKALNAAMKELNISHALILTHDEEEIIENEGKKIKVIPVWKWLLKDEYLG